MFASGCASPLPLWGDRLWRKQPKAIDRFFRFLLPKAIHRRSPRTPMHLYPYAPKVQGVRGTCVAYPFGVRRRRGYRGKKAILCVPLRGTFAKGNPKAITPYPCYPKGVRGKGVLRCLPLSPSDYRRITRGNILIHPFTPSGYGVRGTGDYHRIIKGNR